ncbi:MAG: hypothetical protein U0802_04665 [Candidatus Binatia bacterium]
MTSGVCKTAAVLLGALLSGSGVAAARDLCDLSAETVLRSCLNGARSDYSLALGRCLNLADPASRSCRLGASTDLREARATCGEQDEARDAVCARLGPDAYDPVIDPANFVATVTNPYFPLAPGTTFIYEGSTAEGFNHTEFAVTHNTKVILGVTCVEVHDLVYLDGHLAEDTVDWFAQDTAGNVWYFGENTGELVDGRFVTLAGTFTAGVDGAKAGIIMRAAPAVGDFYRQEFDLANAEDLAEVISVTDSVTVPYQAAPFTNCVTTRETTPLEVALNERKSYAAGIGNVLTVDVNTGDRIALVQITTAP